MTPSARAASIPAAMEDRFLPPAGMQLSWFERGGVQLRYACWPATMPTALRLVILPGFSEHLEKYFETVQDLRHPSRELWIVDWRGLGGSDRPLADGEKGHAEDFADHVADLASFWQQHLNHAPDVPTVLIAHSMGGHLALRFLQEHRGLAHAAILSAPALWLGSDRPGLRALAPAYARAMTVLGSSERYGPAGGRWSEERDNPLALTHDPVRGAVQKRWFAANPFLRIGGPTFGWYDAFFRSAKLIAEPSRLAAVDVPLLVGLPLDDRIVNSPATQRLCAAMKQCRLVEFPGAWHELFMETEDIRSRWMQEVQRLLRELQIRVPTRVNEVPAPHSRAP